MAAAAKAEQKAQLDEYLQKKLSNKATVRRPAPGIFEKDLGAIVKICTKTQRLPIKYAGNNKTQKDLQAEIAKRAVKEK